MLTFRYSTQGTWFKGNTHIHSTASDGGLTSAQLAQQYAKAGYHFLFRTDHWVSPEDQPAIHDAPLLFLNGIELDGCDAQGAAYHVVGIGSDLRGITKSAMGFVEAMNAVRRQGGLLILAHPFWMGNTFEDALRHPFDGVEVYNHVCRWLNGKSSGLIHWDRMLLQSPDVLAFAADDAHISAAHPVWNGGWIVVNAPACTAAAILAGIRQGNYYSSCGPDFHSITRTGNQLHVTTSPVRYVRLVSAAATGSALAGTEAQPLTAATFEWPGNWPYVRIEIEDWQGRCAWTNTLMTERANRD